MSLSFCATNYAEITTSKYYKVRFSIMENTLFLDELLALAICWTKLESSQDWPAILCLLPVATMKLWRASMRYLNYVPGVNNTIQFTPRRTPCTFIVSYSIYIRSIQTIPIIYYIKHNKKMRNVPRGINVIMTKLR